LLGSMKETQWNGTSSWATDVDLLLYAETYFMSIGRFIKDNNAGVAPMLALAALPLFASVGAAIDYSRAASARTAMQSALDASVLLIVKDAKNADVTVLTANADNYFKANFQNAEVGELKTSVTTSSTSQGYSAKVSASGAVKTMFMGIMGFATIPIKAQSEAISDSDGLGCVLALNRHDDSAVGGQGSTSVALNGCSLYDNSDHSTALTVGGSAQVSALSVGVVGHVSGAANITTIEGIRTGIGVVDDPYASVSFPAFSGCMERNFIGHNTKTIEPGVYCGGMMVNAGANITLNPGIYYIDGGDLTVNGGATLQGSDVTLVFTSKNGNGYATATINGNATIDLRAPKMGPTAGIAIFGDRNMPTGTTFKFNGGATQYLGGAVYLPKGHMEFSGGMGTSTNCTQLIGDTVTFTGNSKIALNCKNYGTKPFSPLVVKLTS
jgi:putative Flp pilus-assembly TadE/G-like protein